MAIKKDEQENIFVNQIGVNRGAGFTSASNEFTSQARSLDNAMNRISSNEIQRMREQGKIKGTEVAQTIQYVEEQVELDVGGIPTSVTVYKKPELPDYLTGKTAIETFEKVFYDRITNDNLIQQDSIIKRLAADTIESGGTPEAFELSVDTVLAEINDNFDSDYKTIMQVKGQQLKDKYAFSVVENYASLQRKQNKEYLDDVTDNVKTQIKISGSLGNDLDVDTVESYKAAAEVAGIPENIIDENVKDFKDKNTRLSNFYNTFNQYLNPDTGRNSKAVDISRINQMLKDPTMQSVTLRDGKVVTQEQIENIVGMQRKFISNTINNIATATSSSVSKTNVQSMYTQSLNLAFERINDGETVPYTPYKTLSNTKKLNYDAQEEFDTRYNKFAQRNNIDVNNLEITDSYQLEATGMLSNSRTRRLTDDIANSRLSKESLSAVFSIESFITRKGGSAESGVVGGFSEKELREILLMGMIYRTNNFDADKTIQDYQDFQKIENIRTLDDVVKNIKKGNVSSERYLNNKVVSVLADKVATADPQMIQQITRNSRYLLIKGPQVTSDNGVDDLINRATAISYTTQRIQDYQFGVSKLNINSLSLEGNGTLNVTRHPPEHYFGVGSGDVENEIYTSDDIVDDPNNTFRQTGVVGTIKESDFIFAPLTKSMEIYQDLFKSKLKNTFLDNQIHIAHNVKIGENTIIAGQVGIAGSSTIGNNVRIGGQAGISGHLKIGNNVDIAGGSGVIKDIPDNSRVMGYPAKNLREFLRENK